MSKLSWDITVQFVCSCRIQRWGWTDGAGGAWARAAHCPSTVREGKPFSFGPNPSHYPTEQRAAFSILLIPHEFGAASKRKLKKKKERRSYFRHVSCLFLMFSAEAKWHEAKAALAAVCCFPGWQGHLVGRALCAGAGREKHALLTSHQGQYFISSPACAYLALMLSFGINTEFGGVYRQTSFKEQWL